MDWLQNPPRLIPPDGPMVWPKKIKRVVYDPNPALRAKNQMIPISVTWADLEPWVDKMWKAMYREPNSVGLSACQVGWNVRLFIMDADREHKSKKSRFVFWNAVGLIFVGEPIQRHEGCLSFPGFFGMVNRAPGVILEATTPTGTGKFKFEGMEAHIIQHEWDHQNCQLFTDRFLNGGTPNGGV